jgi:hypothetical protein
MENEGIMALPQEGSEQVDDRIPISSADSYDAALLGLGKNNPQQSAEVRAAVREVIDELDLSPQELEAVLDILEYMSQNPEQYPQLRQELLARGFMDPEDLPEQYDAQFLGMAVMALNEAKMAQIEGAEAVTQMAPEVENLGPLTMAQGGLADMGRYLASQGRHGDSMLAHITPSEALMLKREGGAGTINPATGLPEFFLKKLFKKVGKAVKKLLKNPIVRVVATVALATVLGPTGMALVSSKAAAAAIASGTVTAASGGKVKDVLVSAATGYFGAGGTIGGVNPASAIASRVGEFLPGGATGAAAAGVGSGLTGAGIGLLAGMKPREALAMGAQMGITTAASQAYQNFMASRQPPAAPTAQTQARAMGEAPPQDYLTPSSPAGQQAQAFGQGYMPGDAPAAQGPTTAPAATQVAGAGGISSTPTAAGLEPGKTFSDRLGQFFSKPGFGTFKNAFLVDPNATTFLGKYLPSLITATTVGGMTGGFKQEPVSLDPLYNRAYTGEDYIRDNPQQFAGFLGRVEDMPEPYNPVVPTTSSYVPPPPPVVQPRGPTLSPGGVAQPYNVAGLYGMPDLSRPSRPPGFARGGDPSHFPRKTGPINGPGTGTSDSIPAMLSDGEFVFTARAVRNAGGGSRRKGARRMYALMKKLEGGPVERK